MMNNYFMNLLSQFKQNPMAALGGMGIPQNIQNDPNAIIQHLLNSGRISQQQLNNAINNAKRMGIK